jgi:hypothetical protein
MAITYVYGHYILDLLNKTLKTDINTSTNLYESRQYARVYCAILALDKFEMVNFH